MTSWRRPSSAAGVRRGLAAAATLGRAGVGAIVLERSDGVGASWRARYDGLRLNTPAWMSTLPGYRASHRFVMANFRPVTTGSGTSRTTGPSSDRCAVRHAGSQGDCVAWWLAVETSDDALPARFVVIATGYDYDPDLPTGRGGRDTRVS